MLLAKESASKTIRPVSHRKGGRLSLRKFALPLILHHALRLHYAWLDREGLPMPGVCHSNVETTLGLNTHRVNSSM